MKTIGEQVRDSFIGFALGDALGVPVEFESRDHLARNPVVGMLGHRVHNQPPGTWSDDTSLMLCTAESLCLGYNVEDIAIRFSHWKNNRYWTPHGRVFDIGIQTSKSIDRIDRALEMGFRIRPMSNKGVNERENGNGSLMRILPVAFFTRGLEIGERFRIILEISALTHPHLRAVTGCFIYSEFARELLEGNDKIKAYQNIRRILPPFLKDQLPESELVHYERILDSDIHELPEFAIQSTAYVVHTLEACLWSFLRNDFFPEIVLAAVNLGDDTDTIAALAGGLAGVACSPDEFPVDWMSKLARKEDIINLSERFAASLRG